MQNMEKYFQKKETLNVISNLVFFNYIFSLGACKDPEQQPLENGHF